MSIRLEVIAPQLILIWIMEDLEISTEDAAHIQKSPLAMEYGRLVLDDECVKKQASHNSKAHPPEEGRAGMAASRQRSRRRQPRNLT